MRVDKSARSGGIIRISLIFYNMTVYCVFSFESPHRGDSNEYTQYTVFNIKKKITLNYPTSAAKGLNNEFEKAVVNEPSVFEPLKFYCNLFSTIRPIFSSALCLITRTSTIHILPYTPALTLPTPTSRDTNVIDQPKNQPPSCL